MDDLEKRHFKHHQWLNSHPHYNPCRFGTKYADLVDELYIGYRRMFKKGQTELALASADYLLYHDIREQKKLDFISQELEDLEKKIVQSITEKQSDEELWAFITIGFNEQTVTNKQMKYVSENVSRLPYFKTCQYVLEKHRENGIHHHTHFLVTFHKKEFKSKLIDWIYQTKGIKTICQGKNFIDILGPLNKKKQYQTIELYQEYIKGNKKASKLPYVELDRIWRHENNLDH